VRNNPYFYLSSFILILIDNRIDTRRIRKRSNTILNGINLFFIAGSPIVLFNYLSESEAEALIKTSFQNSGDCGRISEAVN